MQVVWTPVISVSFCLAYLQHYHGIRTYGIDLAVKFWGHNGTALSRSTYGSSLQKIFWMKLLCRSRHARLFSGIT